MSDHKAWFEIFGLVGACLTTFSFLPQAYRIWRSRSPSLIFSNGAGVLLVGSVLALKLQDMWRPRNLLVEIVEHDAAPREIVGAPVAVAPVNTNYVLPTKVPPAAA
jgi:hypothetical protein